MILEKFKPTWTVKSIYQISPTKLSACGIRAVFSDLDNTLIAWNSSTIETTKLGMWIDKLKAAQISLVVVSNNNYYRIEKAIGSFELPFISRALKPLPFEITQLRDRFNLKSSEVVMVGDQLLTDVLAANLAGIRSILVSPIISSDKWNTQVNRLVEGLIVKALLKKTDFVDRRN